MRLSRLTIAAFFFSLCALAQNNELLPVKMEPEELAKLIHSGSGEKPLILYTGPYMFYSQAHILGAEDVGPAGRPDGIEKLRSRAQSLPHDALVVIYCGCCPWEHCPNIRPAYQELKKMGFTKVRVLHLPISFGKDWAEKNYPVAKND